MVKKFNKVVMDKRPSTRRETIGELPLGTIFSYCENWYIRCDMTKTKEEVDRWGNDFKWLAVSLNVGVGCLSEEDYSEEYPDCVAEYIEFDWLM